MLNTQSGDRDIQSWVWNNGTEGEDDTLMFEVDGVDFLLDFWIEALTSSNKSLANVDIDSHDLYTSSWIGSNMCFSSFSTPSIIPVSTPLDPKP